MKVESLKAKRGRGVRRRAKSNPARFFRRTVLDAKSADAPKSKGMRHAAPRSVNPCFTRRGGLLQLGVLGFGGDEDGDVGVGVFPEGEEILIGGAGLGGIARESVGTGQAEMGECTQRAVDHDAAVVDKPLKLCGCGTAVVGQ